MNASIVSIKGSCHCGATQFEVTAPPASVTECNCTFCSKRGVLWAYYSPEQFTLTANDHVVVYHQEGSLNRHHHCAVCGCGTYNKIPCSWGPDGEPDFTRPRVAVNARLFDDFDLKAVPVEHLDGRNLW